MPLGEVRPRRVATANERRVDVGENRLNGGLQTRFVVGVMKPTVPLRGDVGGGVIVEVFHDDPTGSTLLVRAVFVVGITGGVDADEFALASVQLPVAERNDARARKICQSPVRSFVRGKRDEISDGARTHQTEPSRIFVLHTFQNTRNESQSSSL